MYTCIYHDTYLDTSSSDDAHEEVGDDAGDHHHEALNYRKACEEAKHKVHEMTKTRMQPY